jgi:GGDEF domain-containing protein
MLAVHAQVLAALARTADFRWWGDRISLTVSIGAAQACHNQNEGLAHLLERAQGAMESSIHAGGNCITSAPGGPECLPS